MKASIMLFKFFIRCDPRIYMKGDVMDGRGSPFYLNLQKRKEKERDEVYITLAEIVNILKKPYNFIFTETRLIKSLKEYFKFYIFSCSARKQMFSSPYYQARDTNWVPVVT